jgi:hypothetical protein
VHLPRAELRLAVRMQDAAGDINAAGDGHLDRNAVAGLHAFVDEPADDPVEEHILDRPHVRLALPCPVLGGVGRAASLHPALHVFMPLVRVILWSRFPTGRDLRAPVSVALDGDRFQSEHVNLAGASPRVAVADEPAGPRLSRTRPLLEDDVKSETR